MIIMIRRQRRCLITLLLFQIFQNKKELND